jgi:hypothetical protein
VNQLVKKGYSNDYFENDSDEYDNIDCDFLLAVLGEDQNSRKSSVPFNSNVSVTSDLSSQLTSVKMERTRQSFDQNSFNTGGVNKQEPVQNIKAKTLSKTPSLPKSASSRSIQLEASKDRRRYYFNVYESNAYSFRQILFFLYLYIYMYIYIYIYIYMFI